MSESFVKKNIKLSLELDYYLATHPELLEVIPNRAYIVITVNGDESFNKNSVSLVRDIKRKKVIEAHKSGTKWNLRPLKLQAA